MLGLTALVHAARAAAGSGQHSFHRTISPAVEPGAVSRDQPGARGTRRRAGGVCSLRSDIAGCPRRLAR
jgi:hypothetical protein